MRTSTNSNRTYYPALGSQLAYESPEVEFLCVSNNVFILVSSLFCCDNLSLIRERAKAEGAGDVFQRLNKRAGSGTLWSIW